MYNVLNIIIIMFIITQVINFKNQMIMAHILNNVV